LKNAESKVSVPDHDPELEPGPDPELEVNIFVEVGLVV
jgi:hypothetical protein